MTKSNKKRDVDTPPATLDDVIEAYVMSDGGPSVASLAEWIRQYPQFQEELTSLTAQWGLATHLPDVESKDETDEETLVLRGMSVVHSLLYGDQHTSAVEPDHAMSGPQTADLSATYYSEGPSAGSMVAENTPIRGLLIEGKRYGVTPDAFADDTGLSVPLLRKLDRRVIRADSIPREVSQRLARVVRRNLPVLLNYSRLEPQFAQGSQHRASQAPSLPAKLQDFFDAVRTDPELSEERRAALLALATPGPPQEPDERKG